MSSKTNTIVWARMPGYPAWPARYCSAPEEAALSKKKARSTKTFQSAVVFLGDCDRGWINDSSIDPFSSETFPKYFTEKKSKDEDYGTAIAEAVRICIAGGATFSEVVLKYTKDMGHDVEIAHTDVCSVCRGTGASGVALICEDCSIVETHCHCLPFPVLPADIKETDNWFCDTCCFKRNIEPGLLRPSPEEAARLATKKQRALERAEKSEQQEKKKRTEDMNATETNPDDMIIAEAEEEAEVEEEQDAEPEEELIAIEADDKCLLCDLGGKLVLCDFPKCPRVYHHACVLKTFPQAIDSPKDAQGQDQGLLTSSEDAWYCPLHLCANPSCRALQLTDCPATMLNMPSYVAASQHLRNKCATLGLGYGQSHAQDIGAVHQAALKCCSSCSFALCKPCENEIGQGAKLFRNKKTLTPHEPKSIECLNCNFKAPRIRLARLLEGAFMKIASSRLALPFFRPLLPVLEELEPHIEMRTSSDKNESSSAQTGIPDLLALQERIRHLEYGTISAFMRDLHSLRDTTRARLAQILPSSNQDLANSPLILALETLFQGAQLFLDNPTNAPLVPVIEAAVAESDSERARAVPAIIQSIAEERAEREVQAKETMQKLWRRECEGLAPGDGPFELPILLDAKNSTNELKYVLPRPIRDWEHFVEDGLVPAHLRGRDDNDPWSMVRFTLGGPARGYGGNFDAGTSIGVKKMAQRVRAQQVAQEVLRGEADDCILESQGGLGSLDIMSDLVERGLAPPLVNNLPAFDEAVESPSDGDVIACTLKQLGAATTRVLHLESELRRQLADRRDSRLGSLPGDNTNDVIPIGDVHLLQELKLAHMDLQWRLTQRNAAINASVLLVANMQAACGESAALLNERRRVLAEMNKKIDSALRSKSNLARK